MPDLAYVNGKIMPIAEAYIPIEDRGYQFGDAVYEFFASYRGRIFAMEDHLDRLERSLTALAFPAISRDHVRKAVNETFNRSGYDRAGIYLQISRSVAPRNHSFPPDAEPQIVVTVRPVPEVAESHLENGASAITVTDIRWKRCDIKTVQLLPNAWAKQQAVEAGADDAIFVSKDGIVREGSASNVFIAFDGTLITHPLTPRILPGITRARLIAICIEKGIKVREDYFPATEMLAADEVFFTGTVTEVLPITRIDEQPVGNGKPGPLALKLFEWLRLSTGAPLSDGSVFKNPK